ncbi:Dyp-type peroxidase [Phytomonospora endophytica]|uniref:Deferrochelatase/peroxidase EfeB n=1 Tax=Phytomonospora endophytica TaxID=714109 RepID=A0A841FRS5_9ACTN|nr:Dyp-type peroxidase [Phytomonospora endophytica]MBB6039991.1 deferrochelatase/peroxidase EfeB [Phytomonospora endophytica]
MVNAPRLFTVHAAFTVTAKDRDGLESLLAAIAATVPAAEAELTVSVGGTLFDERFGLAAQRPRRLSSMAGFAGDVLDESWCHGDVLVQVGADTDAAATSAMAALVVLPGLEAKWSIESFRKEPTTTASGKPVSRNLFGFKEGMGNPATTDTALMDRVVWVRADGDEPSWTVGGTYQVVRLIRFAMELWDGDSVAAQEAVFGRHKQSGAPLGRDSEIADPGLAEDPAGARIPLTAHIRRAHAPTEENTILRRSHSYDQGTDAAGHPDQGLVFTCFQRDPERGFVSAQQRLAGEALEKYVLTFGGGYFFTLPRIGAGPVFGT